MAPPIGLVVIAGGVLAAFSYIVYLGTQEFSRKLRMKQRTETPRPHRESRDPMIEDSCAICLDDLSKNKSITLKCSHVFHSICILHLLQHDNKAKCPSCRAPMRRVMSVSSDDTDVLLLVPPDLFVVSDNILDTLEDEIVSEDLILHEMRRYGSADTLTPRSRCSSRPRSLQATPIKYYSPVKNLLSSESYVAQKQKDEQLLQEIDEYFKTKSSEPEPHPTMSTLQLNDVHKILLNIEETQKEMAQSVIDTERDKTSRSDDRTERASSIRKNLNFGSPTKDRSYNEELVKKPLTVNTDLTEFSNGECDRLLSLHNLWDANSSLSRPTLYEERQVMKQRLEEERLRRQHCEGMIRDLQQRMLEAQEKIAVAFQVDQEKDNAIRKLHEGYSKIVEQWKELEAQKKETLDRIDSERGRLEDEKAELVCTVKRYESELSKALDLAHGYKDKCESAVKEQKSAQRERDSLKIQLEEKEEELSSEKAKTRNLEDILNEKDEALNQERVKVSELNMAVKNLKKQMKTMQVDKNKMDAEIFARQQLEEKLEEAKQKESQLLDELKSASRNKAELKKHYQEQVEGIVTAKQKDFQAQLSTAERTLQKQMEEKEKAMAEAASQKVQLCLERHKIETDLLEEQHREEIRLFKIQVAQCEGKIEDLQKMVVEQRTSQNELAEKLHNVYQMQWKETLKVISSNTQKKTLSEDAAHNLAPSLSRQNTFTKESEGVILNSNNGCPGGLTYRINETPQKMSPEFKIKDQRKNDFDDTSSSTRLEPSGQCATDVSEHSFSRNSSKYCSASEKRHWK